MKSIADLLRDGDPLAGDHELTEAFGEEAVRHMRQVVLTHTAERGAAALLWRGAAVLASIVAGVLALGTWLAKAPAGQEPRRLAQINPTTAPEPAPARQVQFVTPRGTRVVWVLQADTSTQEGIR